MTTDGAWDGLKVGLINLELKLAARDGCAT